jgi:regulator of sirC expression with transglutaminase-like and TPR domain
VPGPVDLPDPTQRFAELAELPDDELPLAEAALVVAAHDHPLDVDAQLLRLDALAARVTHGDIGSLLHVLFEEEGLTGDAHDYHHPDNSFLDRVLDRRRGLPILLSVLTAEVAARAGVCLAPVAMPGHFLLRDCHQRDRFVDPFDNGALIDRAGAAEIFGRLHGGAPPPESALEPVDAKVVLVRVVTNLVHTFRQRGPVRSLAWAVHLRALLVGGAAWEDAALLRERTGEWHLAAEAWDQVSAVARDTASAVEPGRRALAARARAN